MEYDLKGIALLFMILLMFSMVSAKKYEQNTTFDIRHSVRLDGSPNEDISVNITLTDPDNIVLVAFQKMTFNEATQQFNYTIDGSNVSKTGNYCYDITASYLGINKTESFCFDIDPLGQEFTTSQSILYLVMILLAVGIFGLCLFGAIKIPFKNYRNEDARVVSMNDLKFVKIFLWFITYLTAIWITALATSLTKNFLFFNGAYNFFNLFYWILISFMWPIIVCFFLFSLIIFLNDQKFRVAINNGLPLK